MPSSSASLFQSRRRRRLKERRKESDIIIIIIVRKRRLRLDGRRRTPRSLQTKKQTVSISPEKSERAIEREPPVEQQDVPLPRRRHTPEEEFLRRRELCLVTKGAVAEGETGDGVRETQDDDGKDPPRERRKRDDGVAKHDDE